MCNVHSCCDRVCGESHVWLPSLVHIHAGVARCRAQLVRRIFDTRSMKLKSVVLAHETEVMSVDFSPSSGRLLASGSRDRLVHVFDASKRYQLCETLEQHSSSVTTVRCVRGQPRLWVRLCPLHWLVDMCVCVCVCGCRFARDDSKLMSCGNDKTIVTCRVQHADEPDARCVPC